MAKKELSKHQKKMIESAPPKVKKKEHPLHKAIASPTGKGAERLGKGAAKAVMGGHAAGHLAKAFSRKREMEEE
jgi:hypothetical protein